MHRQWEDAFLTKSLNGTFFLFYMKAGSYSIYNEARSDSAFSPASTFKICNSLIGLESQTMKSVEDTIRWNGHQYSWEGWNKDHCLKTAMPVSCVWFYQAMARRIGRDTMQCYLDKLDYGNRNIGEQIDLFWLNGSIQISAKAQVEFLKKLVKNELPLTKATQEAVKEILLLDENEHYKLYAKTGWAMRVDKSVGWYVGFVEKKDNVFVFVLNHDMTNPETQLKYRKELSYELLKIAGVI